MPCYRCDTVQTDPVKGASPWQRGVVADTQILICPVCQQSHGWRADLDRCAECGATRLVRRLGETTCLECHHTGSGSPADAGVTLVDHGVRPLAAAVETALERVLGSSPGSR